MTLNAGISSLYSILKVALPLIAVLATATTATVSGYMGWRKRQQQHKNSSEVDCKPTRYMHITVFYYAWLFSKKWYSHRSSDGSEVHRQQYSANPSYKETTREQVSRSNSFTDSSFMYSYTESVLSKNTLCTKNQGDCQRETENIAADRRQLEPATPTSYTVTPTNPAPIYWNFKELQATNRKPADTTVQYENPLKLLRKKSIEKPHLHSVNKAIQEEVLLTPYEVPYKET